MRFKVYYDEKSKSLDINCLRDSKSSTPIVDDKGIPVSPHGHAYFNIPENLNDDIRDYIRENLPVIMKDFNKEAEEIDKILEQISELQARRNEIIDDIRSKSYPKVLETCREFTLLHPEFFI